MTRKLIAEFIGTYFLIFAGTGSIMIDDMTNRITHVGVALTFGLVIMALIYTFGHISGAHFNPAVTIGFWMRGDVSLRECFCYVGTQLVAAVAASFTLFLLFGNVAHLGTTLPISTAAQSFIVELILTFVLMIVILGSAVHGKAIKSFAGVSIGATVGLMAMFAGPVSGASMNPARSLGPALVSGATDHLWLYMAAPVCGAIAASIVYKILHQ